MDEERMKPCVIICQCLNTVGWMKPVPLIPRNSVLEQMKKTERSEGNWMTQVYL